MGIEHLISHENVIIEWYFKTDKVVVFDHMWLAICSRTEVKYKMISQVISNIVIILCYLEMSTEQWLQKNDTPFSYLSFKCHMKEQNRCRLEGILGCLQSKVFIY